MKNLIIMLLLLFSLNAFAADKIKFALKSNPKITAGYKGKTKDGKANGIGKATFYLEGEFDGEYEGEWKDNDFHGNGTFIWKNGSKYIGEFAYSRRNGTGEYIWPNGNIYKGDWKNNILHSQGEHLWVNGERYQGTFTSMGDRLDMEFTLGQTAILTKDIG